MSIVNSGATLLVEVRNKSVECTIEGTTVHTTSTVFKPFETECSICNSTGRYETHIYLNCGRKNE